MGFFKMLGSVAETLIDQGNRERERRKRRQHRANREIVKMYNDSEDGGSNYRDIAKKSVGGNHGWYTCPHCGKSSAPPRWMWTTSFPKAWAA